MDASSRTVRIGVTTMDQAGLEGQVADHFGHAPVVTVVVVEGGAITDAKPMPNPNAAEHVPGAMPRFVQSLGVDVLLTGGMGARAKALFDAFGIQAVTGATGTVRQAVEAWQAGTLAGWDPCAHHDDHGHHHGDDHGHHHGDGHGGGCGGHGHG